MAEHDLISKTALLEHLDMAMECENCPRNADKELYKCVHNSTSEHCTCSDIAQICIRITEFATFADVQPVKWISVDEALPIYDGLVLAIDKNNTVRLCIYTEFGWLSQYGNPMIAHITHWQPLPEPPKDGDTNG